MKTKTYDADRFDKLKDELGKTQTITIDQASLKSQQVRLQSSTDLALIEVINSLQDLWFEQSHTIARTRIETEINKLNQIIKALK